MSRTDDRFAVNLRLRFYRQCRLWHGYLSAFAFGALLFFSATGLVLNHPNWFAANEPRSPPVMLALTLPQQQELRDSRAPAQMLTKMVAARTTLYGEYQDGETDMDRIFVRLRGARGSSDISADIRAGSIVVTSERATTMGVLDALHQGQQAGGAWRNLIDVVAVTFIVMSLVGYVIFFSMSARLTTALLITGVSILGIVMFFVVVVH